MNGRDKFGKFEKGYEQGRGALNPNWKGGRIIDERGRVKILVDGKYRFEHRVVMEQTLSRKLEKNELVHHEDENRANNDPSNLKLKQSQKEHIGKESSHYDYEKRREVALHSKFWEHSPRLRNEKGQFTNGKY